MSHAVKVYSFSDILSPQNEEKKTIIVEDKKVNLTQNNKSQSIIDQEYKEVREISDQNSLNNQKEECQKSSSNQSENNEKNSNSISNVQKSSNEKALSIDKEEVKVSSSKNMDGSNHITVEVAINLSDSFKKDCNRQRQNDPSNYKEQKHSTSNRFSVSKSNESQNFYQISGAKVNNFACCIESHEDGSSSCKKCTII